MTAPFRLALAQINPTVGDLAGNIEMIVEAAGKAKRHGADLAVFPELAVSGYPPEDLLTRPSFIRRCREAVDELARRIEGIVAMVGAPVGNNGVHNAAAVLAGGRWVCSALKCELPNYGVFDERRYFNPGDNGPLIKLGSAVIGVSVCEDIWVENAILPDQVADGANLLVNLSSSPYRRGSQRERLTIVENHVRTLNVPFAYCNLVGGQDELVFDGASFVCASDGSVIASADAFEEDILIVDIPLEGGATRRKTIELPLSGGPKPELTGAKRRGALVEEEQVYTALSLGVADYVRKNGFKTVVVALSGGVDSALTATIATDALGRERVRAVYMPSPHSSGHSEKDARSLAGALGVELINMPIGALMQAYDEMLADVFQGKGNDVTEENIQARIRGALIMALSNKFGWLVLATGNKSEIAAGYCTLYGDMVGGFAVLKDVFKTMVYRLCRWRNEKAGYGLIPQSIIDKAPSAELRPGQRDTDSLPPYDELDPILEAYIERELNIDEIEKLGYSSRLISSVVRLVDNAEYKRRQGPIGVKITAKAFGRDRRCPITCRFLDE